MVQVRTPLTFHCHYLRPGHFAGHAIKALRLSQSTSLATSVGCEYMAASMAISVGDRVCNRQLNGNASVYELSESSCVVLNKSVTSWNFMPFLIQAGDGGCLTLTGRFISIRPCVR